MFEKLKLLGEEYAEWFKVNVPRLELILKETYKVFFEKHPDVDSLRFSVTIPVFNDGAPCVPTYSGICVKLIGEQDGDESIWKDCFDLNKLLKDYSKLILDLKEFDKLMDSVEPLLELVYSNDVEVIVNRKFIKVNRGDNDGE